MFNEWFEVWNQWIIINYLYINMSYILMYVHGSCAMKARFFTCPSFLWTSTYFCYWTLPWHPTKCSLKSPRENPKLFALMASNFSYIQRNESQLIRPRTVRYFSLYFTQVLRPVEIVNREVLYVEDVEAVALVWGENNETGCFGHGADLCRPVRERKTAQGSRTFVGLQVM